MTILELSFAVWRVNEGRLDALQEVESLRKALYENAAVQVWYDCLSLLELDSDIYAIRMSRAAPGKIHYEWLNLGKLTPETLKRTWSDAFAVAENSRKGSGELDEGNGQLWLKVGPLRIQWSTRDDSTGWIYLDRKSFSSDTPYSELRFHRQSVADLNYIDQMDPRLWQRLPAY